MKKLFVRWTLLAAMLGFLFVSCSDDDTPTPTPPEPTFSTSGAYILNEGQMGQNNAKLSYYNLDEETLTEDIFAKQNNGLKLGEGGQDILVYGSKIYITVTTSQKIFVTNLQGKLLKEISTDKTDYKEPRYLASHGGYVYTDYYSGHVTKLDTTELKIVNTLEIPEYSEQMTVAKDELYITNSRRTTYPENEILAKGTTVTVVNLANFKIEKEPIEVRMNPSKILSDALGNVFILSMGDYDQFKNALSVIKAGTTNATIIKEDAGSYMALKDQKILLANRSVGTTYSQYDIYKEEYSEDSFITIPTAEKDELDKAYCISIDPNSKEIYVATSDYTTTGSMYIFDTNGTYKTHFKTGGVGPQKTVFVTIQTN